MTGHAHDPGPAATSPRIRRLLTLTLVPLVLLTIIGMVLLWPSGRQVGDPHEAGLDDRLIDATVEENGPTACEGAAPEVEAECLSVVFRIEEGPDKGSTVTLELPDDPTTLDVGVGDAVVLGYEAGAEKGEQYYLADARRGAPLVVLAVMFAIAVVVLGRWRGLAALAGLVVSLVMLTKFMLPAILEGHSPLAVAVIGSSAVMLVALYTAHGFNVRTSAAVIGTLASLLLIGVLGAAFVTASRFSGFTSDETVLLKAVAGQVDLRGLLLAGIVIGSLGVLDDVTVTQASVVWELRQANPTASVLELYRAGIRVGRDHIASTVNTLVLAYAGASLPLLVVFSFASRSVGEVLTGEIVAQEVVRTLVGSIGLVASVPITTALAAVVVSPDRALRHHAGHGGAGHQHDADDPDEAADGG